MRKKEVKHLLPGQHLTLDKAHALEKKIKAAKRIRLEAKKELDALVVVASKKEGNPKNVALDHSELVQILNEVAKTIKGASKRKQSKELEKEKRRNLAIKFGTAKKLGDDDLHLLIIKAAMKLKLTVWEQLENYDLYVTIIQAAADTGLNWKTEEKYILNPSKLAFEIARLERDRYWAYFIEGMRLISTPIKDLGECIERYITDPTLPYLLSRPRYRERLPLGSLRTSYHKARECFDTGPTRTHRERNSDKELGKTVSNNLKKWPPGTIGVHAVPITWDLDHNAGDEGYDETGGRMKLLLMAERLLGRDKKLAFSPVSDETTVEEMANDIKEFLKDIKSPTKTVRLVMEKDGDSSRPTARSKKATLDKATLQRLLGKLATVEEDVPTIGSANAFKVKGRFKSREEMYEYLQELLDKGYVANRRLRSARFSKRSRNNDASGDDNI